MNIVQKIEAAPEERRGILKRTERCFAFKIQDLFEKEFGEKIDMKGAMGAVAYIISYSGIADKIIESDYMPKLIKDALKMKVLTFDVTKQYHDKNFQKIKQELQSYVDGMSEVCGKGSEEHREATEIQGKILNGDLNELGGYLSEAYYAVGGQVEKYYGKDSLIVELIEDLIKESEQSARTQD